MPNALSTEFATAALVARTGVTRPMITPTVETPGLTPNTHLPVRRETSARIVEVAETPPEYVTVRSPPDVVRLLDLSLGLSLVVCVAATSFSCVPSHEK